RDRSLDSCGCFWMRKDQSRRRAAYPAVSQPIQVPTERLTARVARLEPDAPQRLPAAMRASLNIAPVSVLLADRRTTVGALILRVVLRRCVPIDPRLAAGGGLTIRSTSFATACNAASITGWYSPGSS